MPKQDESVEKKPSFAGEKAQVIQKEIMDSVSEPGKGSYTVMRLDNNPLLALAASKTTKKKKKH